jgi:hypothetical protein
MLRLSEGRAGEVWERYNKFLQFLPLAQNSVSRFYRNFPFHYISLPTLKNDLVFEAVWSGKYLQMFRRKQLPLHS